jgi:NAD(P)H-hydrate epimerase
VNPVLSPAEAGALDAAAQERGVSAAVLMENAGREVGGAAVRLAGGSYGRRALVLCGRGNNGGDGFVAARYLAAWGMGVTVLVLEPEAAPREPAAANLERLRASRARVRPWTDPAGARELARADVAVDAIFGTGFRGVPEGAARAAIEALDGAGVPVVAVDIPSGVDGSTGGVAGAAVRADLTVTFGAAKPGVVLHPGAARAGVVEVADIGFPPDLVRSDVGLVEASDVAAWVPRREPDTHKRAAGYAVVVGGSRAMTGAVALMAGGAYRAGAGLVAAAVPTSILPVVQGRVLEAVFAPLPETDAGTAAGGTDRLAQILGQARSIAIGPGMTTDERTAAWIRDLVRSSEIPVVLDADGLNAFAGRAADLADRKAEGLVLTPHAGEFARLAETGPGELDADRLGAARSLAARTRAVVLLKGSRTVVAAPDGRIRINPTGGPVLATGGTGDVLTGMIAGLLARGLVPEAAASAAAYVHGVAGARAGERAGEGVTAGDVLDRVAEAMAEVTG